MLLDPIHSWVDVGEGRGLRIRLQAWTASKGCEIVVNFRKAPHALQCSGPVVWKGCRDGALPICWPLLSCIIPTLFAYFLACHTAFYIFNFLFFMSCSISNHCRGKAPQCLLWKRNCSRPTLWLVTVFSNPVLPAVHIKYCTQFPLFACSVMINE